jgi:hypothetical protein
MRSEHCSSTIPQKHWKCEQSGCECRCHETIIYQFGSEGLVVTHVVRRTRKRSQRGNWLVITYHNGEIHWAKWVQTWAGVQASKRHSEEAIQRYAGSYKGFKGRVIVVDIERMVDLGATEGANEIADLKRLYELGGKP